MRTRLLARHFHLLVASLTLGAGAACGGSIATVENGGGDADAGNQGDDNVGDDVANADGSAQDTGIFMDDAGRADANHTDSGKKDAGQLDANKPDVFTGCATGLMDSDPALCCATQTPPASECGNSGNNNGSVCYLDCRAVCERAAPGSTGSPGFQNCYWSASATDPKIGYACGQCGVGRIPGDTAPCAAGASVGERLAAQAYYEAASVIAFDRLADLLEATGAPAGLVRRAREASAEEEHHAALFGRLARARGAEVTRPALGVVASTLLDLAIENATEGCVRETYGALVALYQGSHAMDPELRAAFARVAEDEISHAALSLDLARWFDAHLTASERAQVRAARRDAERALAEGLANDEDDIGRLLGLPSREIAATLYARLFGDVLPAMTAAA